MFIKTKLALAGALAFGLASAALATDAAPDSVRNNGPIAGQAQQLIEGRNVFVPRTPAYEKAWFDRASNVRTS